MTSVNPQEHMQTWNLSQMHNYYQCHISFLWGKLLLGTGPGGCKFPFCCFVVLLLLIFLVQYSYIGVNHEIKCEDWIKLGIHHSKSNFLFGVTLFCQQKNPEYGQHLALPYVCDQGVPILYHQSEQILCVVSIP